MSQCVNSWVGKPVYPKIENIPAELKALRQWVNWYWKLEEGKFTKPPINPNPQILEDGSKGLRGASHSNPVTWGTYEQAIENLEKYTWLSGIGFVFSKSDPYAGIDLDDCRNPGTGEIAEHALEIIRKLKSYTEISPSQTGVKIIVRGSLPEGAPDGGNKNQEKGIEMYDKLRFFTITGEVLNV